MGMDFCGENVRVHQKKKKNSVSVDLEKMFPKPSGLDDYMNAL